jgi:hypothetical protein
MKEKFIFLLFAVAFFLNTQFNLFHLIPQEKFEYSKLEESETLVIGKLLNSQNGSIFDDGGFTGTYYYEKTISGRGVGGKKSYAKYINNEIPQKQHFDAYKSQIGGQAILYSIFDKVFGLDNKTNILIFRMFNSLALSIILTLFLVWVKRKFGIVTAVISFILLIFNYWIFLYGKSTWWCNWVYFLPFVYGLFFFEKYKTINFKRYITLFSFLFFVKFWFTGFEFITVFLICSSIPYIYYLFENKLSFYLQFIKRHFIITIIPLITAVLFQLFQFKLLTGNFKDGIAHLKDAYTRRSSGDYFYEKEFGYLNNLKKYHVDIITRYVGNSFINEDLTFVKIPFLIIIVTGILCSFILYKKNIERRLVGITWFSIAAPFSWFILFKEHAHIHKHIDFFIWYCPFLLLLILLISLTFNLFLKTSK